MPGHDRGREVRIGVGPAYRGRLVGCQLIGDVLSGEVGFDTTTRIPERVTILGLFKRHTVGIAECHVVVGFPGFEYQTAGVPAPHQDVRERERD